MALSALIDPGRDARPLNGQRPSEVSHRTSHRQPSKRVGQFLFFVQPLNITARRYEIARDTLGNTTLNVVPAVSLELTSMVP